MTDEKIKFVNEEFPVTVNSHIRTILKSEVGSWIELVNNVDDVKLNIQRSFVINIFEKTIRFASSVNDDNGFSENLALTNKVLAENNIPSYAIYLNRFKGSKINACLLYLYGLFNGSVREVLMGDYLVEYFNYYISGVCDQDYFRSKSFFDAACLDADIKLKKVKDSERYADAFVSNLKNTYDKIEKYQSSQKLTFDSSLDGYTKSLNDKYKEYEGILKIHLESVSGKLDDVIPIAEKTARDKIGLIELQKLWNDKLKVHSDKEKKWMWALGIATIASIVILFVGIVLIGNFLPSNNQKLFDLQTIGVVVLIVILFWFIRLITKIWLSHSHLKNDAHERSVMTQTYLSLLVGGGLNNEQKNMVFQAIFRPVKDGILKDDGPNSPVLEIVEKIRPGSNRG